MPAVTLFPKEVCNCHVENITMLQADPNHFLNFGALRASRAHHTPCWWALSRKIFVSQVVALRLRASFPMSGYTHLHRLEGGKRYDLRGRLLPPLLNCLAEHEIPSDWIRLSEELRSTAYRLTLGDLA